MAKVITKVYHNWEEYQFWWSGGGAPLPAVADLVAKKGNNLVKLTWTDPNDVVVSGYTLAYWKSTKVVRKVWSAPVDSEDGTLIYTETTRNSHVTTPYVDNTAVNDTTYYYAVFAVANNGEETISNVVSATPKATQTFTITYMENSSPTGFSPTYSDDASGLTAGSTAFDEFFNYSAVKLSTAWVETAEVTQTTPWQLNLSSLWTLTSGDNVMIKFPRMWIKMTKNGSTVTLSITDDPDAESDGFQYYAHSRWTFDNMVAKDAFYLWAFKAYNNSWVLKSWSGKAPTWNQTQSTFITQARANDNNNGSAWYDIIWYYQRQFINALYMMKYWNPDSQSVVGRWYVASGHSTTTNTWWSVAQTSATYGSSDENTQIKLFWLEDRWGNIHEWIWGMCTDGSKNLWTALSWFTGDITTSSPYANTWSTIQTTSWNDLSSIVGNNKVMFWPSATVNNSSYNTYYCDYVDVYASCLAVAGGAWTDTSFAGAFLLSVARSASNADACIGARLMFL